MKNKLVTSRKSQVASRLFFCFLILLFSYCPFIGAEENPGAEDTISLDLKNIEVVELLRLLSLKTGKTIVPSAQVQGRITLFLNNVKFEDILDMIVVTNGFAVEKKGDIYYIITGAEYKAMFGKDYFEPRSIKTIKLTYARPANVFNALSQLKSDVGKVIADEASGTVIIIDIPEKLPLLENTAKELDQPLETAVYDLNYAKPADAKTQLSAAVTPGTGEVIIDERSGKAIISDLPKKMEKLKSLVKELDTETRQVYIETDIVEVTLNDTFERGIDWEKIFSSRSLDGLDFNGSFANSLITTAFQKIAVGTVPRNNYIATLNFLEDYGDVKIISQPRIAVVNNEEANVMVGTREAYTTGTVSTAGETAVTSETVEFIDVGIKLKVTPTINQEGFITMKIKPEVSSVSRTLETENSVVPIVQTSEASTTVKVKDGAMIMIAGLMKETHSDEVTGIPVLSRIPLIGALFGNRTKEIERSELVIFITPHLMRGDVALPGTEPEKLIREDIMPEDLKQKLLRAPKMSQAFTELEKPELTRDKREQALIEEEKIKVDTEKAEEAKKILVEAKSLLEEAKRIGEVRISEEEKKLEEAKAREQSNQIEKIEDAKRTEEAKIAEEAKLKAEEARWQEQIKVIEEIKVLLQEAKSLLEESRKLEQVRQQDYQQVIEKSRKIEEAKNLLEEIRSALEETRKQEEQKEKGASAETIKRIEETKNLLDETKILLGETREQAELLKLENIKRTEEAGKREKAREADKVRKLEEAKAHYLKGLELQKAGSWLEAKLSFERAIDLGPAFAPSYNQLGIILEIQGSGDEAEKMYLKAISVDPDYLAPYSNLALINEVKNNKEKAVEYWKKRVASGDPNDIWTKEALQHLEQLKK